MGSSSKDDFLDSWVKLPRDEVVMRIASITDEDPLMAFNYLGIEPGTPTGAGILETDQKIYLLLMGDSDSEAKELTLQMGAHGRWLNEETVSISEYGEHLTIVVRSESLGDIGLFNISLGALSAHREGMESDEQLIQEMENEADEMPLKLVVGAVIIDADIGRTLQRLSIVFQAIYERTTDVDDLDQAIQFQTKLVDFPLGDPLFERLGQLSDLYKLRFESTAEARDIEKAVLTRRRALDSLPLDHPSRPEYLGMLGLAYSTRYTSSKKLADIEKGLSLTNQALEASSPQQAPKILDELANSIEIRFQATNDPSDLDEAISTWRRAVALTALTPDERTMLYYVNRLHALSRLLQDRFQVIGNIDDLEEATTTQRTALALIDDNHPRRYMLLCNFGIFLFSRFKYLADLRDLEESLLVLRRAVLLTPENATVLPTALNNLALALHQHFEQTQYKPNLDEAIEVQRKSISLTTPMDHPDMPARLNNLGILLQTQFEETGDLEFAREGVSVQEAAVRQTPEGDGVLPIRLTALANAFNAIFGTTREDTDIDAALHYGEMAISLFPPDHRSLHMTLYNVGQCWRRRFRSTRKLDDIDKAIERSQRAVDLTPPGSASMPLRFLGLGRSHLDRYRLTKDKTSLREAQSCFENAATSRIGSNAKLLDAARLWIDTAALRSDHTSSIAAFDTTIKLISLLAGLEQTVENRHKSLENVSSLSLDAAATAFELDQVDKALEWLEQGRCLVWRQLTDLRTPLDGLRLHDERLAERVLSVSRALEKAGTRTITDEIPVATSVNSTGSNGEALEHVTLAKEWDELLQTVRVISGFEDFLQPPSISALLENLPDSGPVVIINVHEKRCDAIGLIAGLDPLHIPLPLFSLEKAESLRELLQVKLSLLGARSIVPEEEVVDPDDLDETSSRAMKRLGLRNTDGQEGIASVLEALWINLVEPILDALGFSPSDVPGRIWWCPTGPLTFLPIHAAGIYTGKRQVSLADYAVSSYTPTVTSLTTIIQGRPKFEDDETGITLIANADSSETLPQIPGTKIEISNILQQTSASQIPTLVLEGEDATIEATLAGMESHSCIHFACHAAQDAGDPLRSGFHLHGGRLSLSTIMKRNLKHADLAFLSACQTSTGDNDLSEEAVHLAAGMMAAGYRGVIGTMWSIPDQYAPVIAQEFYADLLWRSADGQRKVDGVHAAYALHHSVQALRSQLGDASPISFLAWVPYVHFGL